MNPLVVIGCVIAVALSMLALPPADQGTPEQCRKEVVSRFEAGSIASVAQLDAELLECGK